MSPVELNIHFPVHNQVIIKFGNEESETLAFHSPIIKKDLEDLRWYIETYAAEYTGEPDDEEAHRIEAKLITLGETLFKAVFSTDSSQNLFRQFQQQHSDRLLTIHTSEAEILALPWELLREPQHNFLSQQHPPVSIRRYCVKSHLLNFTIQAKPELRLLFVVSRPTDEGFLDPRLEPQAVMNALAEQAISQIEVEFLRPATLEKLTERLENKNLPPIDIIHFDGHGVYDEKDQQGYLLFENSRGKEHLVSAECLSEIVAPHHIALVVLSACQSATIGNEPFGSVAAGLTDKGVPSVLAMVYSVLVQTTRLLFARFYKELATGKGIGAALDSARQQLATQNQRGTRRRGEGEFELTLQDWFVPALYQASNDSALLDVMTASPLKDWQSCANLPKLQAVGFYGRSRELWQIERWFVQGVERITITGFGGQGKTWCAIEAAHWLLQTDLFDSVCFVDFSRYQGLDALRYAMNALGVLLDTTLQDENAVPPVLQTRRLLWVWDNLESLAAETLDELLTVAVQWSAHSRFLFTTRQHRFTQANYAESNPKHQYLDLAGLAELDALAYFNCLWQTAPMPEQPYPVRYELITLISKVAFHPLSIGLLAQQLKTRTIAELGERLEALLLCEPEDSEDKSLLASLKLSLERLPPEQRELVKRLGVFQGGAWEPVIKKVIDVNDDEWSVLRSALECTGLIQIEPLGIDASYLKFHPILAPALWQELSDTQQTELLTCYVHNYYGLSETLYSNDKKNPHSIRSIAMCELPNLFYAVYAAIQARETFAVYFVDCVYLFVNAFGLERDKGSLNKAALQATDSGTEHWFLAQSNQGESLFQAGDYASSEQIFLNLLKYLGETPSYNLCITLSSLGHCFNKQGNIGAALSCYAQGLTAASQLETSIMVQRVIAILYTDFAQTLTQIGRYDLAKIRYQEALAIFKEIGDVECEALVNLQLGSLILTMKQDHLPNTEQRYQNSLIYFQALNNSQAEAETWLHLGIFYQQTQSWQAAEQAYRESARIKEAQGDLVAAANTWNALAILVGEQGKLDAAESWFRKAIDVQRQGDLKATYLVNLASILKDQVSRLDEAQVLAEEALTIKQNQDEFKAEIWKVYQLLAQIATNQQQIESAKHYRQKSHDSYLRFLRFSGVSYSIAELSELIYMVVAVVLRQQGGLLVKIRFLLAKTSVTQEVLALQQLLATLPEKKKFFVNSIQSIINGERNREVLLEYLNYEEAAFIHLILQGIEDPESLESLFNS